jgi:hypothetical protein
MKAFRRALAGCIFLATSPTGVFAQCDGVLCGSYDPPPQSRSPNYQPDRTPPPRYDKPSGLTGRSGGGGERGAPAATAK